jgi:hypothetical protein
MKKINRITIQMDINKTGDDALREIILFQNSITRNEADEAEQSAAAHPFWQHLRKSILSSKPGK